ncbi:DUF2332 domain-containing protein [Nocardioides sp. GY 10113]|uniref:DUF2332 domain-containing protein n=1 Tax=Nocardioides sp. GY 10113 TaxID=2569761 RepID=UPI0010A9051B|nr:DUF2332 domain-containing protein [Nocardioides sp. GY 10113]TIC88862.1 DUF2332 domain-containing protein [Nocardioides sp. GY 10113]
MEPYLEVAASYRDFAAYAGDSPTLRAWALAVAEDEELIAWIGTLPPIKQQPNLVFAAARWHGVPAPGPYDGLRDALLNDDGRVRTTILTRATQTNEVGRLATLLPAIAGFPGPLALVEVGASAGLCLYPDRWGYAWELAGSAAGRTVTLGPEPRLPCRVSGPAPLPTGLPEVAFRGGIDLNPLDVTDHDAMAWLTTLVWPEQEERRRRLRHGIELARADPPAIRAGNLLTGLPDLVEEASAYGTVVVFHSAVIAYLEPEDRVRFDALIRGLVADGACHWVSNEGKQVLPSVTLTGPPIASDHPTFVLGVDGRMVARTHGHGRSLTWTA